MGELKCLWHLCLDTSVKCAKSCGLVEIMDIGCHICILLFWMVKMFQQIKTSIYNQQLACPCVELSFNVQPVIHHVRRIKIPDLHKFRRTRLDQMVFTLKLCYVFLHMWNKICEGAHNARMIHFLELGCKRHGILKKNTIPKKWP